MMIIVTMTLTVTLLLQVVPKGDTRGAKPEGPGRKPALRVHNSTRVRVLDEGEGAVRFLLICWLLWSDEFGTEWTIVTMMFVHDQYHHHHHHHDIDDDRLASLPGRQVLSVFQYNTDSASLHVIVPITLTMMMMMMMMIMMMTTYFGVVRCYQCSTTTRTARRSWCTPRSGAASTAGTCDSTESPGSSR
jgi:hypothetical protein